MQYSAEYLQLLTEASFPQNEKLRLLCEQIERSDIIDAYIIMSMPSIDDPAAKFVKDEIMNSVKQRLIDELTDIIEAELKHLRSETSTFEQIEQIIMDLRDGFSLGSEDAKLIQNEFGKTFHLPSLVNKRKEIDRSVLKQYMDTWKRLSAAAKGKPRSLSHSEIGAIFGNFDWEEYYGGENWAKITAHVIKISTVKGEGEFFKALDRLVDFVHNSGSILTKFKGYKDGWIQFILDIKEKASNIRELIPYASKEVQKMFGSQEWRQMLTKIPGEGAERSVGSYKIMLPKYVEKLANLEGMEEDKGWLPVKLEAGRWTAAIGHIVNRLGVNGATELLNTMDPETVFIASKIAKEHVNSKTLQGASAELATGKKFLLDWEGLNEMLSEGSEKWKAGYKRRVVRTTKPEHKKKGYMWRIKGKDRPEISIKLYKNKPSYTEFTKQMRRVAGHEFGG